MKYFIALLFLISCSSNTTSPAPVKLSERCAGLWTVRISLNGQTSYEYPDNIQTSENECVFGGLTYQAVYGTNDIELKRVSTSSGTTTTTLFYLTFTQDNKAFDGSIEVTVRKSGKDLPTEYGLVKGWR